jgi:delta 1-pyrroline-5-carboxylate dehydrogenase
MYRPAAGRAADQILEALSGSDSTTLFGGAVGDGLDQERQDAAAAVAILRNLVRHFGASISEEGGQHVLVLHAKGAMVMTATEAEALTSLLEAERGKAMAEAIAEAAERLDMPPAVFPDLGEVED